MKIKLIVISLSLLILMWCDNNKIEKLELSWDSLPDYKFDTYPDL